MIALTVLGANYSYDLAAQSHRWTLQRPLCENRPTFLEKIRGIYRIQKDTLGLGIAFNGTKAAPPHAHRRGLWLPHCENLTGALSFGAEGPIVDVVAGTCGTPQEWVSPPPFPSRVEF